MEILNTNYNFTSSSYIRFTKHKYEHGTFNSRWCVDKSTLSLQISECEEKVARAEADVRLEREWRTSLQEKEVKLKEQINSLQMYIQKLTEETKKCDKLKEELEKIRKQWAEAQTTLEEMGIQLVASKLQYSELQEMVQIKEKNTQSDGLWTPDSIASNCKGCKREFSITRRKHHCRNCGEIFCRNCSKQVAPLPNESGQLGKPVRVCDTCWNTINKDKK